MKLYLLRNTKIYTDNASFIDLSAYADLDENPIKSLIKPPSYLYSLPVEETRLALVKELGWACLETSSECDTCTAKEYCKKLGVIGFASVEQRMGCGVGACLVCSVKVPAIIGFLNSTPATVVFKFIDTSYECAIVITTRAQ